MLSADLEVFYPSTENSLTSREQNTAACEYCPEKQDANPLIKGEVGGEESIEDGEEAEYDRYPSP